LISGRGLNESRVAQGKERDLSPELEAIPAEEARTLLNHAHLTEPLTAVLTDGTVITGKVSQGAVDLQTMEQDQGATVPRAVTEDSLVYVHEDLFQVHFIFVPLIQIAGLIPQLLRDRVRISVDGMGRAKSRLVWDYSERSYARLMSIAAAKGFKQLLWHGQTMYSLAPTRVDFQGTTPIGDTLLYLDWHYFQLLEGGLKSIGLGFAVSGSIGWQTRLADRCWKSIKGKRSKLANICSEREPRVLEGRVTFFETPKSSAKTPAGLALEMEGATWRAGLISSSRLHDKKAALASPWALAYFREDGFLLDHDLWEKLDVPSLLFGDLIQGNITTDYGTTSCAMFVRSAGVNRK
jgi:hypothetical protein